MRQSETFKPVVFLANVAELAEELPFKKHEKIHFCCS